MSLQFTDLIQWNCEGILKKKEELEKLVTEKKPICVCLQETKLRFDANYKLPGYKSFLKNLEVPIDGKAHGGVGILVRNDTSAFEIDLNTTLQAIAVSVKLKKRTTVCSLYLPPGTTIPKKTLADLIEQLPRPFLLLGDFNAKSKLWYNNDYCQRGKMVEQLIEEGDFFFLDRDQKTHFSRQYKSFSHVDLSLCSIDLIDSFHWEVDEDYHNSDHTPIFLKGNTPRPKGRPQRWILDKADWTEFRGHTEIDENRLTEGQDIDEATSNLNDLIINAANQSIPKSKGTGGRQSPPWWNKACYVAIKKRKAAWNKYKRSSTDENYISFSRLRAEAQRIIRYSKRKSWTEFVDGINSEMGSGTAWRKINLLQNKFQSDYLSTLKIDRATILVIENAINKAEIVRIVRSFGTILELQEKSGHNGNKIILFRMDSREAAQNAKNQIHGGQYSSRNVKASILGQADETTIYDDPIELANCLGRRFEFVSSEYNCDDNFNRTRKQREHPIDFTQQNRNQGYNARITRKELDTALNDVTDSAPGPDGVQYSMLKHLAESGKAFLLDLFNKIFDTGKLPQNWKLAHVIPILKEGKCKFSPDSYRPIALTSCICKLMERILNKRLMWYLVKNKLIHKAQCGFQKGKSTLDNLAALETEIHNAFVKKQLLLTMFFDLEKAYDTCWRYLVLKELHGFGMRGNLPLFIVDFLQDRKFQVKIGDKYSDTYNQEMGVPQGSVLSVTLFLIAINTVLQIMAGQTSTSLYVDDMRISIAGKRLANITRRMQSCLRKLDRWTEDTGFRFSSSKTEVLVFHRQRGLYEDPDPALFLHGKKLKVVKEKKFLGLVFDQKLTWIPHIKSLKARGIKALNVLKIITKNSTKTNCKTLLNIYRAIVRSKLDYACQIYGTASPSALKMLNTVHHQALRLCTGAFRTSPVESLYVEAGEPSLENRRTSLTLQYYIRSKKHPVDTTIVNLDDNSHDQYYDRVRNKPKSLSYRARHTVQELGLEIPTISLLRESKLGPWEQPDLQVCMALSSYPKETTTPEEFIQNFRAHRHHVDLEIYTDGSKSDTGVGAGFGIMTNMPGNSFQGRRLHYLSSVFSAELYAIKLALLSLRVYPNKSCVIYSDSRSALQAIQKSGSQNKLVLEINELVMDLHQHNIDISFCWIPSDVGIDGNELADKAAKSASQRVTVNRSEVSASDMKACIKDKMRETWKDEWFYIETNKKLRSIQPTLKRVELQLSRKEHIKLTRLRIGHTRLTHGPLLTGDDLPTCIECTWDEEDPVYLSVKHILMECGNFALYRYPFFDPASISMSRLLSDQDYVHKVFDFLKQSEIYDTI